MSAYKSTIRIKRTSGAPKTPRDSQSPESPEKYLKPLPRPERLARSRPTPRTPPDRPSNHSLNQSQVRPGHVFHVQREHRPHPDRSDRPDGPPPRFRTAVLDHGQTIKDFRTKRTYTNQKKRVPAGVLIKYPQLITIQEPDYYFTLTDKFTAAITEAEAKAEAHRSAQLN
jgi:hypothetical protein